MKTKHLILAGAMLFAANVFPHGTRGGDIVVINGVPELRDLVDKTNCYWKTGEEMKKDVPYIETAISNIAKVDWYFAEELSAEIEYLSYCQTSKLKKINTEDENSRFQRMVLTTHQGAIRLNSDVYIDMELLNRISPRSQAMLLIHEAIHSYIGEVENRNHKVRSIVKILSDVEEGKIIDRKSFHLQMSRNEVNFPTTVAELTPYKTEVLFLLATPRKQTEILAQQADLALFYKKVSDIPQELLYKPHVYRLWNRDALTHVIEDACANDNLAFLDNALNSSLRREAVISTCLGVIDLNANTKVSKRLNEYLTSTDPKKNFFSLAMNSISKNEVFLQGGKIMTSPGLLDLSAASNDKTPRRLITVRSMNLTDFRNGVLRGIPEAIAHLTQTEEGKILLKKNFFDSSLFQTAFGITKRVEVIKTSPEKEERELAIKVLTLVNQYFWDHLLIEVERQSNNETKEWVLKEVTSKQLGFSL